MISSSTEQDARSQSARASTGSGGAGAECGQRIAGLVVIGGAELFDALARDLGCGYRLTWLPHEPGQKLLIPRETGVAVIEVGPSARGSGSLPLELTLKLLRGAAQELEFVFVLGRDALEPLLRANRSPSIDFVVQPAPLDELAFRTRRALSRVADRRWALHLEAALESLRLAAQARALSPAVPAVAVPAKVDYREAMRVAHEQAARDYLDSLLRDVNGNVARAAKRAGLERESLHRLLRRYGIRSGTFKSP